MQDKANLPQATARNQVDKKKCVSTIVGDASPNGSIMMKKVARVTQRCNLEREAVADAFGSHLGSSEYGFLEPLHYGIATPPSQRLRVRLAAGSRFFTKTFSSRL